MTEIHRQTRETDIHVKLDMTRSGPGLPDTGLSGPGLPDTGLPDAGRPGHGLRDTRLLDTGLPFFDHMLNAMAFHGGFHLEVQARGDIEVDPHHLVEDTGLVIGQALETIRKEAGAILRYGEARIPMDDALAECVVDAGGRPFLAWNVSWPQDKAGDFDLFLLREFFWALAVAGKMNLHLTVRYAENGHHAAEALFKATGRALAQAFILREGGEASMSTKGLV